MSLNQRPLLLENKWLSRLLIIAICSVAYFSYNSLQKSDFFYLDDQHIYESLNEIGTGEKPVISILYSNYLPGSYYRPLAVLSFYANYNSDRKQTANSMHRTNVLLHLLVVLFLYFVLEKLGISPFYSMSGAALFALHPLHLNAIGWIAGRSDLLSGLFGLLSLYSFLAYLNGHRKIWLTGTWVFTFLGALSKENAVFLPVVLAGLYLIKDTEASLLVKNIFRSLRTGNNYSDGFKTNLIKDILKLLAVPLLLCVPVLLYLSVRFAVSSQVAQTQITPVYLIRNFHELPETYYRLFVPFGIKVLSLFSGRASMTGAGLLLASFLLLIIIRAGDTKKLAMWALLWFSLFMIPGMFTRSLIFDTFFYWDCRSYLPGVGVAVFISLFFEAVFRNKSLLALIVFFVLCFFTYEINQQVGKYSSRQDFWQAVMAEYPENSAGYVGSLLASLENNNYVRCDSLDKQIKKNFYDSKYLCSTVAPEYEKSERFGNAASYWQRLSELEPDNPSPLYNMLRCRMLCGDLHSFRYYLNASVFSKQAFNSHLTDYSGYYNARKQFVYAENLRTGIIELEKSGK